MRSAVFLVALLGACTSTERRQDVADSGKGIPPGFRAAERTELRTGDWRFYHISARDPHRMPREDNLVLRDVTRMTGEEGVSAFVHDEHVRERPDGLPPTRFAEQLAMFLVHGRTVEIADDPPAETRVIEDVVIHRSTLVDGQTRRQLVVEIGADGKVKTELTPPL